MFDNGGPEPISFDYLDRIEDSFPLPAMTEDPELTGVDDIFPGDEDTMTAYDGIGEIESLYEQVNEVVEEIEQRAPVNDTIILTARERTRLLEFYVVGHAHLERLTTNLIYETIADKQLPPKNTIKFFRDFTQAEREELLYRVGVVDEGMKGEMKNIRDMRNQLVHQQHQRMYVSADEHLETMVDRAFAKIKELDDLLNEIIDHNQSE